MKHAIYLDESLFPSESLVKMKDGSNKVTVFMVHPIEGHVEHLQQLASQLDATVYGLQCSKDAPVESIEHLAAHYIKVSWCVRCWPMVMTVYLCPPTFCQVYIRLFNQVDNSHPSWFYRNEFHEFIELGSIKLKCCLNTE